MTEMDRKAQAADLWAQEVRKKFTKLLQDARDKLLEQEDMAQQEERLEEQRAKEK